MKTKADIESGHSRFRRFRDMLREGRPWLRLQCDAQIDNLEVWRASGPGGAHRFIVIIGPDGFDLFHESASNKFEDDVIVIAAQVRSS